MEDKVKEKIFNEIYDKLNRIDGELKLCVEHELIMAYRMLYDHKVSLIQQLNQYQDWFE